MQLKAIKNSKDCVKKVLQRKTIKISKVKDYVKNRQEIQLKTINIERDRIKGKNSLLMRMWF